MADELNRDAPIAAQLDQDAERAAFEKHFCPKDKFAWRDSEGNYKNHALKSAWEVWQAARCTEPVAAQLDANLPPLPKVGPICYAMAADVEQYKVPRVGKHLPGVYDVALWSTDQFRKGQLDAIAPYAERIRQMERERDEAYQEGVKACQEVRELFIAYIDGRTAAPTQGIDVAALKKIANEIEADGLHKTADSMRLLLDGRTAGTAWISIDERLPEQEQEVVVFGLNRFTGKPFTGTAIYREFEFHVPEDADESTWCNSHWTPLPAAPSTQEGAN